ncbi:MAG TPA: hypothetical protein VFS87_02980 [Qipengyuania sp.]|nr:hypothetical protein [Qipengyuania sp.]
MTKAYLIAAVSLGVFAAPQAQAQLLGGGGGIGGQLGGTLSGAAGPLRSLPSETLRSTTRGSARGDANTTGSQRVDRRRGSVAVDRSLEGSLDAAGAQIIDTPAGSGSASGSGRGSASGSGSADAQLIGTDAVRDVTGRTVGRARGVATTARERAGGLADRARSLPGSANGSGSGSASGQGSGSIGSGMLAAAGSGAAAGDGAFAIAPGMPVLSPDGERFGKVRQIVTDSRGRVQGVLVRAKDRDVMIPSGNLSGSGSALVMGQGEASTVGQDEPAQPEA